LDLNSETTKHARSFRPSIIPQQITRSAAASHSG
jgi:hypothetical protein